MTKKAHQQKIRLSPLGEAGMAQIRKIVEERQCAKVNEVLVDGYSASLITQVYDALSPENRAKLLTKPVAQVADICFKVWNPAGKAA